jgi:hypothetical protein
MTLWDFERHESVYTQALQHLPSCVRYGIKGLKEVTNKAAVQLGLLVVPFFNQCDQNAEMFSLVLHDDCYVLIQRNLIPYSFDFSVVPDNSNYRKE